MPQNASMKDQNAIQEKETKEDKWTRAHSLFLESLYKADHELRGCSHNQKCYHELIEIRDSIIEYVRKIPNPYKPAGNYRAGEPVKSINGISVVLLGGALGPHYMQDWTKEQVKEWEEYAIKEELK